MDLSNGGKDDHRGALRMFNPSCQHDRTSYDIMTCDECAKWTAENGDRKIDLGTFGTDASVGFAWSNELNNAAKK